MKLAIQEDMLPGRTEAERYKLAEDLGFDGIELWVDGLDVRLMDVAMAINDSSLEVASVHLGHMDGYLSPDSETREAAVNMMRESLATAVDLQAPNVVFVPHWGNLIIPDASVQRSAEELANDLMVWLLRGVSDLAMALGTTLHMQPRHRADTDFLNTLEQAVKFSDEINNNPYIRIAPCTFDMSLEENDIPGLLKKYADRVGYLYLADSNMRLAGQGSLDWAAIGAALKEGGYDGWLCLSAGYPVMNPEQQAANYEALPKTLETLKAAGLH